MSWWVAQVITASALLELSVFTEEKKYRDAAVHILNSLGWVHGLRTAVGTADAVLAANQHDCQAAGCTLIETEYYMYLDYQPPSSAVNLTSWRLSRCGTGNHIRFYSAQICMG